MPARVFTDLKPGNVLLDQDQAGWRISPIAVVRDRDAGLGHALYCRNSNLEAVPDARESMPSGFSLPVLTGSPSHRDEAAVGAQRDDDFRNGLRVPVLDPPAGAPSGIGRARVDRLAEIIGARPDPKKRYPELIGA